jgi:hypothetical protein
MRMPVLYRRHTIEDRPGRASLHAVQLIAWPPDRMNAICLASLQGHGEPRSERRHNTLFIDAGRVRVRNHFHRRGRLIPPLSASETALLPAGPRPYDLLHDQPDRYIEGVPCRPEYDRFFGPEPIVRHHQGPELLRQHFFSTALRRRAAPASGSPNFPRLLPRPCQPLSRCLLPASAV